MEKVKQEMREVKHEVKEMKEVFTFVGICFMVFLAYSDVSFLVFFY